MKKIFLLLAGSLMALGTNAQYARHTIVDVQNNTRKSASVAPRTQVAPAPLAARTARATAVTFVTEDFASGTSTTLPTGWSAGSYAGGTWHWADVASTSAFTLGVMHSTTASNGWMIFDSDSLGTACSCAPSGWLQSPAYNCSAHTTVRLNFENYYRSFYDSCSVWVSTSSSFATHTDFPVLLNDGTATNASTANPSTVNINITSVAGSQATVYIRFVYYGNTGGSYSWMIDDLSLSELDPVDVGLEKPAVVYYNGTSFSSFGIMPTKIVDTVYPETYASNYGATAEPTTSVNAQIFQGASGTAAYNKSVTIGLPISAYDSLADFTTVAPGYYSNTKTNYLVAFSTTATGDAVTTNNVDTANFMVSDTVWSENPVNTSGSIILNGGLYVYRPAGGGNAALAFSPATEFNISAGKSDTLTSVSVAFESTTVAGQIAGAQIYHFDAGTTTWVYDGVTKFRALAASDISTTSSLVYADFPVDVVATSGYIVLNGGAAGVPYAAVVKGNNNTAQVVVLEGNNPAVNSLVGYVGLEDTSNNNGSTSQDFGNGHLPYADANTPLINMNFGKVPTAVQNVLLTAAIGKAYPNPANTSVNIPFTMSQDGAVTVTLCNVMGQAITSKQINAVGGRPMMATFATGNLPDGIYMYTVEVNGGHTTGRIAITH